jgi:DNA-directed RNA polymerase subunit RPC12/RpoP
MLIYTNPKYVPSSASTAWYDYYEIDALCGECGKTIGTQRKYNEDFCFTEREKADYVFCPYCGAPLKTINDIHADTSAMINDYNRKLKNRFGNDCPVMIGCEWNVDCYKFFYYYQSGRYKTHESKRYTTINGAHAAAIQNFGKTLSKRKE